jgi:hypothetical protein
VQGVWIIVPLLIRMRPRHQVPCQTFLERDHPVTERHSSQVVHPPSLPASRTTVPYLDDMMMTGINRRACFRHLHEQFNVAIGSSSHRSPARRRPSRHHHQTCHPPPSGLGQRHPLLLLLHPPVEVRLHRAQRIGQSHSPGFPWRCDQEEMPPRVRNNMFHNI